MAHIRPIVNTILNGVLIITNLPKVSMPKISSNSEMNARNIVWFIRSISTWFRAKCKLFVDAREFCNNFHFQIYYIENFYLIELFSAYKIHEQTKLNERMHVQIELIRASEPWGNNNKILDKSHKCIIRPCSQKNSILLSCDWTWSESQKMLHDNCI